MTNNKLKFHAILRSLRHGETGGALVETALTLPLLVTLTLGSVELARVAYTSIEVANAAKAAVSYGAQNLTTVVDTTGIQTVATNDASDLYAVTTATSKSYICADNSASTGANTDCVNSQIETILTVTTTTTMTPIVHIPGLPTKYTLHGQAVQKVLQN